jgi:hypothetical protein
VEVVKVLWTNVAFAWGMIQSVVFTTNSICLTVIAGAVTMMVPVDTVCVMVLVDTVTAVVTGVALVLTVTVDVAAIVEGTRV